MFLHPFLISDHQKEDLIPAPMTIVFPFNASYFGAKVEWMFLRPLLISDHQKEDLIPAPIMVRFPSDAAYFWRQSWAIVSLPAQCFYHQKEDLIPAPIMGGFPPMHLISGAKVGQLFLRPFLISDIRKRISYLHQWRSCFPLKRLILAPKLSGCSSVRSLFLTIRKRI